MLYSLKLQSLQSSRLVCPVFEEFIYVPGGHGLQVETVVAPTAAEYLAAGQSEQAALESRFAGSKSSFPNFPPAHNLQRVALVAALAYFPAAHASHAACPKILTYPLGHVSQIDVILFIYCPGEHRLQNSAPGNPTTKPPGCEASPLLQDVQSVPPTLSENQFIGHSEHSIFSFSGAYFPGRHSKQLSRSILSWYWPIGQPLHLSRSSCM